MGRKRPTLVDIMSSLSFATSASNHKALYFVFPRPEKGGGCGGPPKHTRAARKSGKRLNADRNEQSSSLAQLLLDTPMN